MPDSNQDSVLILSPHLSPMQTGLSHYTKVFATELMKTKKVSILTSNTNDGSDNVLNVVKRWKFFELCRIFKARPELKRERVLVQYVPFMYERRGGINFSFCFFLLYLSLVKSKKIDLMVHEVNYPFRLTPKEFLMFVSHNLMMVILRLSADHTFVATSYFYHLLKTRFFFSEKKLTLLPVGSNMPTGPLEKKSPSTVMKLCMFGTLHPAKEVPAILKICLEAVRENIHLEIDYLGATIQELVSGLSSEDALKLKSIIRAHGFVEDRGVGKLMQQSDYLLAFFIDGLSARRGTVMAALQNGLEVISTQGEMTEDIFKHQKFIHLFAQDISQFGHSFKNLLKTQKQRSSTPDEVRNFYEDHFSWNSIVKTYVETVFV